MLPISEYNSEMKNVALCLLTMALMLSSGCSILFPDHRPRVKEVADKLDAIPIGTPLDQIAGLAQIASYNGLSSGDNLHRVNSGILVWGCLVENPVEKNSDMTLYRQVPDGILLQVMTNDYELTPPVIEDGSMYIDDTPSGTVEIFFDSDKKYKGYFAYALYGSSKDSKERLELGEKQFVDSGTIQWSEYVRKADNYSSSYFQEHYPKIPLSQNTEQLSAPLPDHEISFYPRGSHYKLRLSDEDDQMLYSKAMELLASSTFNSEEFNWNSSSKYGEEYRAMTSGNSADFWINFLPQGEKRKIDTLAGEINVHGFNVGLNYENSTVVIFTPTKYHMIAHDKFDSKLCHELLEAVKRVSTGE